MKAFLDKIFLFTSLSMCSVMGFPQGKPDPIKIAFNKNASTQNQSLHFEHLGLEEGLSNETVLAIYQDSKGYLWFGTEDGLNKYDGYSFTKYRFDPFDVKSLAQNSIYTIWEDKDGFIWVGTFEGLCRFDRRTEKFSRFKPSPVAKFSDPNITAVNEDSDGMIWAGSFGGLCRFDRQKGIFLPDSFGIQGVTCIKKDKTGTLWIGSFTGFYKMNLSTRKGKLAEVSFIPYQYDPDDPNSLSSNSVRSIFEDHEGKLWLATDNGINSFDRKTGMFTRYQHDPKNIYTISTNQAEWLGTFIQEDLEGNLWIGTAEGLNKLSVDRRVFTAYRHNPEDASSLSHNVVISLHIDSAGILYAGTQGGKLNKANLNPKPFGLIRRDPKNINSLSSNEVTAILEDSSGFIWIGTFGKGLNRWNKRTNQFMHFRYDPSRPTTLRSDTVMALLKDLNGTIWVCNGNVLSKLKNQTGEFIHYYCHEKNDKDPHQSFIFSITKDREGFIWLATGRSPKRFDEKTEKFKHYYYDPADTSGVSDWGALSIFADSRDNIWVGHGSRATDRFDKKEERFVHYKHDPDDSTSISSNIVKSSFGDSAGNLWLGTMSGGLCYFDYQTERFTTFTDKHGLPANNVYSLLTDNSGHLWLGTSAGLSQYDPVKKTFTNYDVKDGLQSNIFASGIGINWSKAGCFKGVDGILYFGGNSGINFFDPQQLKPNSEVPPIVITQFKLFDKLMKGFNESKKIVLNYNQNYFSFEFASLSFYNPAKNKYAYMLEGVDDDWVISGSRRYVAYTNIDPGTYTFKVKGTNNDGIWNDEGASIRIIINPPWWRTWWAYTLYVLLFIIALWSFIKWRTRSLKKEKEILEQRVTQRTNELKKEKEIVEETLTELKSTQAQLIQSEKMASLGELTAGIAHEIQNPLNFVNNFSDVNKELLTEMKDEMKRGNIEEANSIANDVIDNEEKISHHGKRAESIVKGMLQHSRTSSGQKEPTDINALADEYLRLAYHGLRAKDKSFNPKFETSFDNSIGKINVNPQDIGRVILNLINNAFYAVSEKAKQNIAGYEPTVIVSTKKENGKVVISVADNGTGIPQKVTDKIFQPFFTTKPTGQGTGLGLSLAYDIITKGHGGELKVETKEGEGSEFRIILSSST